MSRLVLLPLLALAACSSSDEFEEPAPATREEAEALEDAASMLDEQRLPDQLPETDVTEGESE